MGWTTPPVKPTSTRPPTSERVQVNHWIVPLMLALALLYLLVAWSLDLAPRLAPPTGQAIALITFSDAVSYEMALDDVTSVGLRLAINNCVEREIFLGDTHLRDLSYLKIPEEVFADEHDLAVSATTITPGDWVSRLAGPDVSQINTRTVWHCPLLSGSSLGRLLMAPPVARPAALHFASTVAYGDALVVVAEQGLRLADPCYEAAVMAGKHPAWHNESQREAFVQTGTLVVAPTILTPNEWLLNLPSHVTPEPVIALCAGT